VRAAWCAPGAMRADPVKRAGDHSDPEAPGPPTARQVIGVVLSILAVLTILGWAPVSPTSIGIALLLIGLGMLL